ncbi:DNA polymerase/3'-5' exonuclease PolX [Clostridiaceae bacterium 35-E11]
MDKKEVSAVLNHIGLILELRGENPFKIKAYYNGARIVELLEDDIEKLVEEERLGEKKGIGKALQEKITELVTTGELEYYETLKDEIPEGLFEILKIPGLGPKKVKQLYDQLQITTLGELEYACLENRLIDLKGFDLKTQNKILKGIENLKKYRGKYLISDALHLALPLVEKLQADPRVIRCSLAGSIRRKKEMIKDIDILASAKKNDRKAIMDHFIAFDEIENVTSQGETKLSVRLISGVNVDLRIVENAQYPYALHHFTGSKEHNTAMRHRAKEMGLKMNEYGLFTENGEILSCKDEEELFHWLKLQYIPPELRENNGEIEAAENHGIPRLVEEKDIQGVFHVHTSYSDGVNTIEEMTIAASKKGYKFIGISDHSQSAFYAHGLKIEDIWKQHEGIDKLNEVQNDIYVFKGIESDILINGCLDYEECILDKFDYVIASVHNNFNMTKEEMTHRLIKAVENKHTKILGHPSGRLLLSREEYPIDIKSVLKACKFNDVAVEINANPHRLDLDWRFCKIAKEMGVKIAIEPDAHKIKGLGDVYYGVGIARKGWLEPQNIINTFTLEQIKAFFKK